MADTPSLDALVRYHPERYRRSRPFARQVAAAYQSIAGRTPLPTKAAMDAVTSIVMNAYNAELDRIPISDRPRDARRLMKEPSLAMHYGMFCSHGRQIFHFRPELTEQFRRTDIDDVPAGELNFPYEAFYLSFGRQADLDLRGHGAFADGAYISFLPNRHLQIVLTTQDDDGRPWFLTPDNYYYLSLPLNDPAQSISTLAAKALEDDLKDLRRTGHEQPPYLEAPGGVVRNRRPETVQLDIAALADGFPVFTEALKLIINGLCYLTAYPEDIETAWPEDTPTALLEKIDRAAKPKDVQRTMSKLTSMGYTKVHFCGKSLSNRTDVPTGQEVASHWRRGHWRNQPHGPRLTSRKLVWIMPVLVRKDRQSPDGPGRVYLVE